MSSDVVAAITRELNRARKTPSPNNDAVARAQLNALAKRQGAEEEERKREAESHPGLNSAEILRRALSGN